MRLIVLLVILSAFVSIDTYCEKVHVQGQWNNGPEAVVFSYAEDAVTPKFTNLKASIDPVSHRFEFSLEVTRPTMLQFQDKSIIVLPGDTVKVNVTGNEPDTELRFEGRYRMEHDFLIRLKEAMGLFTASQYKIDERLIEKYKVAATHHYDSSLLFLKNDVKKFKSRKSFEKIAQGYLTSRYYSDLLYPVVARLIAKEKLPKYYFELVDFTFFKATDFLGLRDFIVTASQYNDFYYTDIPPGSYYDSASVASRIKSVNYNFFGEVKDNLLLSIYTGLVQNGSDSNAFLVQLLYEYLAGVFSQESKRIEQLREFKHGFDIVNKPFPLKILEQQMQTTKGKTISLAEVLATNEVIYIDFWASWCGPCIGEMPAQQQLISELEGKQVKFILISFDEDEKQWQKAMSRLKVKGDHYLITEGFSSALARYISFNEIPRYLILDKEGRLVSRQAPGPSSILANKSQLLSALK